MATDSQNMIKVLEDFAFQCREALELPRAIKANKKIKNIVVLGMGGSAIGGDILKAYLNDINIGVDVIRGYDIPDYVSKETLVFAVSYSGNTEETISALRQANEREASVIGITSGGKLKDLCETVITIPKGYQPRAALGYLFLPILGVLHNTGIKAIRNYELNEMLNILKKKEEFKDKAEGLAKKLRNKIPIIYSSENLRAAAYRFKTQINENAKLPSFYNVFPEMNHNEIMSFKGMDRKFIAVIINDIHDNERVIKRMKVTSELIEETVDVLEINAQGEGILARIFSVIYLADFTSYYLALLNRTDPTPVEVIETLKRKIKD